MRTYTRRIGGALLYITGWTLLALISASQSILTYAYAGTGTVNRAAVLKVTLPLWYIWAVLSLGAIWAARRWPIGPGAWRQRVALHIALNIVFAVVAVALNRAAREALGLPPNRPFGFDLMTSGRAHVLTYWIVVGLVHVMAYYRNAREREVRAAALSAELAEARLDALRMQLHPHFLFNTMHAISGAIREDPAGAENMLAELADLLRTTVDGPATHEVTLRDELAFIRRYVGIQQVRFGNRLEFGITVAGDVGDALVPQLILQPLVENAIEHGIATRRRGGRLEIHACVVEDQLELSVADDGAGFTSTFSAPDERRVGLRNTRARLAQLYGERGRLELRTRAQGGIVATVVVPYRVLTTAQ